MRLHVINFKIGDAGADLSLVDAINLANEAMNADFDPQVIESAYSDDNEPATIYNIGTKIGLKAVLISTALADINRQLNLDGSGDVFDLPDRDVIFQVVKTGQNDFEVNSTNNKIDFQEAGGALEATVATGNYTASNLCTAIKTALEAAGGYTYTVTYNSGTSKFTIAAGSNFSLLFSSGDNVATSIHSTIGFASSDVTGSDSYTADYTRADLADGQIIEDWTLSNVKCSGKLSSAFKGSEGIHLPIELLSTQDTELTIEEA